jgi:hypothetical protein
MPRNSGYLETCHNLAVYNSHLETLPTITLPDYGAVEPTNSQLFIGREANYLCGDNRLITLDSSFAYSTHIAIAHTPVYWSIADFGAYVVFSSGTKIYVVDPSTGLVSLYGGSAIPICRTICNFKGQLIAGSPTGYDPNVVLWGDIGYADMVLAETNVVIGYMPMPWQGYVHCVKRLGDNLVAYGSHGIAVLVPMDLAPPGFGLREISQLGVMSAGAVGGDIYKHVFVRSDGMLCTMTTDIVRASLYKVEELGAQEFFQDLTDIRISHDARRDEYYISSEGDCFLLSTAGLSTLGKYVSTCYAQGNTLYGMYSAITSTNAEVVLDVLDLEARSIKAIEMIELGATGTWIAAVDWRNTTTDNFQTSPYVVVNPMGVARVKVSGVDFKIRLVGTGNLDYMTVRWKQQDRRFVRGLDVTKAPARADQ